MTTEKLEKMKIAQKHMVRWLSHQNELRKRPAKIICTRGFYHDDLKYYIFKFKIGYFDVKWYLAICGGYPINGTLSNYAHCGHVFSNFKTYDQHHESDDALALVHLVKSYWDQHHANSVPPNQMTWDF